MILKNFDEYLIRHFIDSGRGTSTVNITPIDGVPIKDRASTFNYSSSVSYYNPFSIMSTIANGSLLYVYRSPSTTSSSNTPSRTYGVGFGTGNAPATHEDYSFSGDIITTISASDITMFSSYEVLEDHIEKTVTYTITNKADTAITIGEIGLFSHIAGIHEGASYMYCTHYTYPYLIERTALEAPITIEAGGIGQITYTIKMKYPNIIDESVVEE